MAFNLHAQRAWELTVHAKYLGQQVITKLHYRMETAGAGWPDDPLVPDSTSFLTTWRDTMLSVIKARQSTLMQFSLLRLNQVDGYVPAPPNNVPVPHYDATDELVIAGVTGNQLGDVLPSYAAVTMRKRTAVPGKRGRGSTRFGGIVEASTQTPDGNLLDPVDLAAWLVVTSTLISSWRPVLAQANNRVRLCVLSLKQMQVDNPLPPAFPLMTRQWAYTATTCPVNEYLGSQVSRKVGHGA